MLHAKIVPWAFDEQAAGGNSALALGLTVGTNMLGILTIPFTLSLVLGKAAGVHLPPGPLLSKLCLTILIPVIIGKLARSVLPTIAVWVDKHKKGVSLVSNSLLILVPWMQVCTPTSSLAAKSKLIRVVEFYSVCLR